MTSRCPTWTSITGLSVARPCLPVPAGIRSHLHPGSRRCGSHAYTPVCAAHRALPAGRSCALGARPVRETRPRSTPLCVHVVELTARSSSRNLPATCFDRRLCVMRLPAGRPEALTAIGGVLRTGLVHRPGVRDSAGIRHLTHCRDGQEQQAAPGGQEAEAASRARRRWRPAARPATAGRPNTAPGRGRRVGARPARPRRCGRTACAARGPRCSGGGDGDA
jgi:hypothetical protein